MSFIGKDRFWLQNLILYSIACYNQIKMKQSVLFFPEPMSSRLRSVQYHQFNRDKVKFNNPENYSTFTFSQSAHPQNKNSGNLSKNEHNFGASTKNQNKVIYNSDVPKQKSGKLSLNQLGKSTESYSKAPIENVKSLMEQSKTEKLRNLYQNKITERAKSYSQVSMDLQVRGQQRKVPTFIKQKNMEISEAKKSSFEEISTTSSSNNNFPQFSSNGGNLMKKSSLKSFPSVRLSRSKFSISDFEKIKELGTGKQGKVFLVRERRTQCFYAIKVLSKQAIRENKFIDQIIREIKIQMFLNHPNIVKMYGFFDDSSNVYLILEACMDGLLYQFFQHKYFIPERSIAKIMKQVFSAVLQLHANSIIHRDIKPENIVIHQGVMKICDFGWSVHQDQISCRTTFCGTPVYVCPEILMGQIYDEKVDIWALGIMLYEMFFKKTPFQISKEADLIKIVKNRIVYPSQFFVDEQAKDLIDCCLRKDPSNRKQVHELINHSFIKKYERNFETINYDRFNLEKGSQKRSYQIGKYERWKA